MRPRVIRWNRATPTEARAQCAQWLRGQGYGVTTIFGDLWLVRKVWR